MTQIKLSKLSSFDCMQAIEQIKLLSKIDSAKSIILIHQRYLDLLSQKHMEVEESVHDKTKIVEYNPKLQEVFNIKRKELKEHYQEIVGLKPELYIIDFENTNKYSLSKPKTIEAYLNLMPNITENERNLIEKSGEMGIKLGFVMLGERLDSKVSKESPKDIFMSGVIQSLQAK